MIETSLQRSTSASAGVPSAMPCRATCDASSGTRNCTGRSQRRTSACIIGDQPASRRTTGRSSRCTSCATTTMTPTMSRKRAQGSSDGGSQSMRRWIVQRGDGFSARRSRRQTAAVGTRRAGPCQSVLSVDQSWRARRGSNARPLASEASTLSTELRALRGAPKRRRCEAGDSISAPLSPGRCARGAPI